MNIIKIIQSFIVFQSLLLLIFLFANKKLYLTANRTLGMLVGLLGSHMLINLLNISGSVDVLRSLSIGFGFLYGPFFLNYVRSLIEKKYQLRGRVLLHSTPAVLFCILSYVFDMPVVILAAGIFISLACYGFSALQHLTNYRRILSQNYSNYEKITLSWLSWLIVLQVGILVINVASVAAYSTGYVHLGQVLEVVLFVGLLLLVSTIIFQGLQHPILFEGLSEDEVEIADISDAQNAAPDAELISISRKLDALMLDKELFLKPGLTVRNVAQLLTIPARQVSQAINVIHSKNFSEYVNYHRIRYAKNLMASSEATDLSILEIMYQSGFNTKSNFNRVFKAETGLKPYEYRNGL